MAFNLFGILKNVGKGILGFEESPAGKAITLSLIGAVAPEFIPLASGALNILHNSVTAVANVEIAYKDKTGASDQKAAEAALALSSTFDALKSGFAEFGYTVTVPPDELKKLNDLTLAVLDQINIIKTQKITITKNPG